MSADNGIYIAKFPDGYRVIYAQAIENISYFDKGTEEYNIVLQNYFGHSELFHTELGAYEKARNVQGEYEWTEYGIVYLGELPHWKK